MESFKDMFNQLKKDEKVSYTINLINAITRSQNEIHEQMDKLSDLKNNSTELEEFKHYNKSFNKVDFQNSVLSSIKKEFQGGFLYVDISTLKVLTPSMEKSLENFVNAYEEKQIDLPIFVIDTLEDSLYNYNDKIKRVSAQDIVDKANKDFEEGIKELRDKYPLITEVIESEPFTTKKSKSTKFKNK